MFRLLLVALLLSSTRALPIDLALLHKEYNSPRDASDSQCVSTVAGLRGLLHDLVDIAGLHIPPPREVNKASCSSYLSCGACSSNNCGWCIGERVCVEDAVWMCQGEDDMVADKYGKAKCPAPSSIPTLPNPEPEITAEHRLELSECIGWRQTAGCDSNGSREPEFDLECDEIVPPGASGYCECSSGKTTANVGCSHVELTCSQACADPSTKFLLMSKEELARVRDEIFISVPIVDAEEIRIINEQVHFRAERVRSSNGVVSDPYVVMELEVDATQGDIRKAYRRLSLILHPDRNSGFERDAVDAFTELVAAYDILRSPSKRASYDDYGGRDGFQTQWEYEQYGTKDSSGFYSRDSLVSSLTERMWHKNLRGNTVWLVEFYAPWCKHCQSFVQSWKKIAESLKYTDLEVAAVNCETEINLCRETFNIRSYPTIRMVNKGMGMQQEYLATKDVDNIVNWATDIQSEWSWLVKNSNLETIESEVVFDEQVVLSEKLWFVLLIDGVECDSCKTAKTNMMRLTADLPSIARFGVIDCSEALELCKRLHMPPRPHAAQLRAWGMGPKTSSSSGETLFNPTELDSHVVLQLISKIIRLTINQSTTLSSGPNINWDTGEVQEEPNHKPAPMWNAPRGRAPLNIGRGSDRSNPQISG